MVIAKWKSVRDSYTKYKKKEKEIMESGLPKKPRHRYLYSDMLGFLDQETDENAVSNLTNDSEEPTNKNTSNFTPATSSVPRNSKSKKNRNAKISSYIKEPRELMEKRTPGDIDDEDMSFFKSVLPTVRRLNPDQKMQFRIHIMSYLQGLSAMQGQFAIQQLQFQQSAMHHNYQQSPQYHTYFQPSQDSFQAGQVKPYRHHRLNQTSIAHNQQTSSNERAPSASPVASSESTPTYNHEYSDDDFS